MNGCTFILLAQPFTFLSIHVFAPLTAIDASFTAARDTRPDAVDRRLEAIARRAGAQWLPLLPANASAPGCARRRWNAPRTCPR